MKSLILKDYVKTRFKCLACSCARGEMEDVNNHFMENHRDTFRLACSQCNMKYKTIKELKLQYAANNFKKRVKKRQFISRSTGYIDDEIAGNGLKLGPAQSQLVLSFSM